MAKVLKPYTDKYTGKIYLAGDDVTLDAERQAELAKAGYVEAPKAKPATKAAPKRATRAKAAK